MTLASIPMSEAQARAGVYAFLAEVFDSHPTQDALNALRRLAEELAVPFPSSLPPGELDCEYMELFVVPNPRYVAPYESVFLDEWELPAALKRGSDPSETGQKIKGLLMGESTLKVREYYLRAGILPDRGLPDHISNELRLLAYLSQREAAAADGEAGELVEIQAQFQRGHLLKWISQLRERIEQRERLGYYSAAVRIAEAVLPEEADTMVDKPVLTSPAPRPSGCPWHRNG